MSWKSGYLPDGTFTENPDLFCEEWKEIREPISKYFGLNCVGFNDAIWGGSISYSKGSWYMNLPVSIIKQINKLIEFKEKYENSTLV